MELNNRRCKLQVHLIYNLDFNKSYSPGALYLTFIYAWKVAKKSTTTFLSFLSISGLIMPSLAMLERMSVWLDLKIKLLRVNFN
jgi:hypothetical protein